MLEGIISHIVSKTMLYLIIFFSFDSTDSQISRRWIIEWSSRSLDLTSLIFFLLTDCQIEVLVTFFEMLQRNPKTSFVSIRNRMDNILNGHKEVGKLHSVLILSPQIKNQTLIVDFALDQNLKLLSLNLTYINYLLKQIRHV